MSNAGGSCSSAKSLAREEAWERKENAFVKRMNACGLKITRQQWDDWNDGGKSYKTAHRRIKGFLRSRLAPGFTVHKFNLWWRMCNEYGSDSWNGGPIEAIGFIFGQKPSPSFYGTLHYNKMFDKIGRTESFIKITINA